VQLTTVRFVGTFVADPTDVPGGIVEYLAEQLDVAAASMATYTQREKTRLEHQWEIARDVGYRDFVDAEAELAVWVDDRAWTTGEGPVAVFNGAVGWLRERQVLLPGVTTLARLVARERDAATLRVWTDLAQPVSGGQARLLRGLLVVPEGSRRSELDRMRKAATVTSGAGMVRALRRVSDVAGLGLSGLDVSAIPHRRVVALARYGMAAKATALRRHPEPRRLATLVATVRDGLVDASDPGCHADNSAGNPSSYNPSDTSEEGPSPTSGSPPPPDDDGGEGLVDAIKGEIKKGFAKVTGVVDADGDLTLRTVAERPGDPTRAVGDRTPFTCTNTLRKPVVRVKVPLAERRLIRRVGGLRVRALVEDTAGYAPPGRQLLPPCAPASIAGDERDDADTAGGAFR